MTRIFPHPVLASFFGDGDLKACCSLSNLSPQCQKLSPRCYDVRSKAEISLLWSFLRLAFFPELRISCRETQGALRGRPFVFIIARAPPHPLLLVSPSKIGKPHPDPVVENTSLAAVQPPDVKYETNLPPASQQQLSEVQMESVIYAGQQFSSSRLPNGERRGIWCMFP